ncbi:hypothetical protein [Angustibacter aerolatus]
MTHLLAATTERGQELPMTPVMFGITAFAVFLLLLGLTWAFRHVGNKHR